MVFDTRWLARNYKKGALDVKLLPTTTIGNGIQAHIKTSLGYTLQPMTDTEGHRFKLVLLCAGNRPNGGLEGDKYYDKSEWTEYCGWLREVMSTWGKDTSKTAPDTVRRDNIKEYFWGPNKPVRVLVYSQHFLPNTPQRSELTDSVKEELGHVHIPTSMACDGMGKGAATVFNWWSKCMTFFKTDQLTTGALRHLGLDPDIEGNSIKKTVETMVQAIDRAYYESVGQRSGTIKTQAR